MKNFKNTIKYSIFILVLVLGFAKVGVALAEDNCNQNEFGGFQLYTECYDNGSSSNGDDDSDDDDDSDSDLNVSTSSATSIEDDSATLRGEITGINDTVERFFEWGTSSSNLNHTATVSGTTSHEGTFSKTISGLNDNDTYYFRACAEETDGNEDDCGSIRSFTTDDADGSSNSDDDAIVTTDANYVTSTQATINGVVINEDGSQKIWFEWGPTTSLGFVTPSRTISAHESIVSSTLYGLTPGHAYFFRLVSDSGDKGDYRAFVTSSATVSHTTPTNNSSNGNNGNNNSDDDNNNDEEENGGEIIETIQYLDVDIVESKKEVRGNEEMTFAIVYENTNDTAIKNLIMTVDFPAGLTPTKTELGTINGQKVNVVIPSVAPLSKGNFIISADVADKLRNDTFLVSVVEASYDHPVQEDTRVETVNSSIVKVVNGNTTTTKGNNQAASAGFAGSFFPHTIVGWLIMVIIMGVIIFLAIRFHKKHEDKKNSLKIVK